MAGAQAVQHLDVLGHHAESVGHDHIDHDVS